MERLQSVQHSLANLNDQALIAGQFDNGFRLISEELVDGSSEAIGDKVVMR
jgi:hypothetical protein